MAVMTKSVYQFDIDTQDSAIYTKIDWYSAIFNDMSFNTVLRWLGLEDYVSEFAENVYEQCQGLEDKFVFNWRGVRLETAQFNFYGEQIIEGTMQEHLFDKVIPKIRLDISGSGLDNLRQLGMDVDTYLRTQTDEEGNYVMPQPSHVTRIDFAFDLINYRPDFLDQLIDHCEKWHTPSDRVLITSDDARAGGGIKYTIRKGGGQKTLYLGAPTSDKMLRIYDKKLQYTNSDNTQYVKENPYGDPDSWIRIELQCRKKLAHGLCFPENRNLDKLAIFKYIYDKYNFADVEHTTHHNRRPAEFWANLFDWEQIAAIVQNTNSGIVQSYEEVLVASFFTRGVRSFLEVYTLLGRDAFWENVQTHYLDRINDISSPDKARRKRSVCNRLDNLGIDLTKTESGLYGSEYKLYVRP